jgi:hypothetical protein
MASFRFKIKFENSSLRTHGEFSIQNHIRKLATTHTWQVFDSKFKFENSSLRTHGEFSIQNHIRKLATTHTWQVFDSKSNSKTRHYALTASFRFKIIFKNLPLPTHGEFWIQNQIQKLATTHTWRVLDSKSNSKTCHYPHMASFRFKIKFENSSLRTHGEFSIQNHIRKLATTHTWRVLDSKSNSKTRHYPLTASFRFKIIFENWPLPTHGEFLIQNQIRKLATTHTWRVFDSKSYSKTRHYPIKIDNQ